MMTTYTLLESINVLLLISLVRPDGNQQRVRKLTVLLEYIDVSNACRNLKLLASMYSYE